MASWLGWSVFSPATENNMNTDSPDVRVPHPLHARAAHDQYNVLAYLQAILGEYQTQLIMMVLFYFLGCLIYALVGSLVGEMEERRLAAARRRGEEGATASRPHVDNERLWNHVVWPYICIRRVWASIQRAASTFKPLQSKVNTD